MEGLRPSGYDSVDIEVTTGGDFRGETSSANLKHNGAIGPLRRARTTEPATTMANELLTQTEAETRSSAGSSEGHELDALLGKAFEEKPIWTGLYESIRDVFFPPKLPPLELTSTPIPVPDRMAVKPNPLAIGLATGVNLAILALLLFFGARAIIKQF